MQRFREVKELIKNKYLAFGLSVALFLVLWHLLDFLFNTFITGKGYQFSPIIDLVVPLAVSVTVGCILFLRKKK